MRRAVIFGMLTCLAFLARSPGLDAQNLWPLDRTGLSMMLDRKMSSALPYHEDTRWQAYEAMQNAALTLWFYGANSAVVATSDSDVHAEFPDLTLMDNDGDGIADFFAYYGTEDDTHDFGAFFRSPEHGDRLFWLVMNGELFSDTSDPDAQPIWFTFHVVDRDGDGKIDLMVSNDLDFNGDGMADGLETIWVFDSDGDGIFERAEYLVQGVAVPAAADPQAVAGLTGFSMTGSGQYAQDSFPVLAQAVFDDLSTVLGGVDR